MKKLCLLALVSIILTSCAVSRAVKYDGIKLDLFDVKTKNIDLALLDHREAVIDGSRKPDFVGYMRSNVGIAWPIGTKSKNNFADDLLFNVVNSLKRFDINVTPLKTKPSDDEKNVKQELFALSGQKKVLMIFDELHTDGYAIQVLHYKINVYVFDKAGKLMKFKFFDGDKKLGGTVMWGAGPYKTYMPIEMGKLFEDLFKDKEVLQAINEN